MDYPQINPNQVPGPSRSWKWVIIVIILIVLALAWYFYTQFFAPQPSPYNSTAQPGGSQVGEEQTPGDTTGDIAQDLNQLPSDSEINNELNFLDQNFQDF